MHTFLDCSVLLARKSLSQHDGNSHSERESQSSIMTDIISITFVITEGGAKITKPIAKIPNFAKITKKLDLTVEMQRFLTRKLL